MHKQTCSLLLFHDKCTDKEATIPFEPNDYVTLVDWSDRTVLHNKRGSIPENTPPILYRLGIDEKSWIQHIQHFERQFPTVAGNIDKLKKLSEQTSRRWIKGMGQAFKPVPT